MSTTSRSDDPLVRVEGLLTQLLLAAQHQAIDIARIQDEITALRQTHSAAMEQLHEQVITASQRTDWFHVQFGDVLRVALRELRDLRATQVCAALNDGPISAQLLAELVRPSPEEELILELPSRLPRPAHEQSQVSS